MIRGELKTTKDGDRVIEVDYYATRQATTGESLALSLIEGASVETEHGVFRISRVGRVFKCGRNGHHIYLYVQPADAADDLAAHIAKKVAAKSEERLAAYKRPAPSLGADAPIGW